MNNATPRDGHIHRRAERKHVHNHEDADLLLQCLNALQAPFTQLSEHRRVCYGAISIPCGRINPSVPGTNPRTLSDSPHSHR